MIIEFLSRQNEEIVQVEIINKYSKEIESNDPIILSKFESEIFRDWCIDVKVTIESLELDWEKLIKITQHNL